MNNPLVDPNSQFQWGDYLPVKDGGDHGGTAWWNPFTPGQGYTTNDPGQFDHWFSGLPVIDSAQSLGEDIANHDAFKAVVDYAAVALDIAGVATAAATGDWGGLIVAPIASWIMEHVKPLRLLLDELTGNQDTVDAIANTWDNMSKALGDAAKLYHELVQETGDFWHGPASDAYRNARAQALGAALTVAGILCRAWGLLLHIVGECVKIVHDLVRELIAALIGQLVQDAVEAATVVGAAAIPEQSAGEIARVTTVATEAVSKVVKAAFTGVSLASKIVTVLGEAVSIVERLGKELKAS